MNKTKPLISFTDKVVSGMNRGHKIGYPTANLKYFKNGKELETGVYVVTVKFNATLLQGVANVGKALTFFEDTPRVDVHILDFQGDLYGKSLTLNFWKKLREVKQFRNEQELIWQIEEDIEQARKFFEKHSNSKNGVFFSST